MKRDKRRDEKKRETKRRVIVLYKVMSWWKEEGEERGRELAIDWRSSSCDSLPFPYWTNPDEARAASFSQHDPGRIVLSARACSLWIAVVHVSVVWTAGVRSGHGGCCRGIPAHHRGQKRGLLLWSGTCLGTPRYERLGMLSRA